MAVKLLKRRLTVKTTSKTQGHARIRSAFTEESLEMAYPTDAEVTEPNAHWTEDESHYQTDEVDTSENLLLLYFLDTRRIPLLTGQEEKRLSSYIEQEKYLNQIEHELASKYDREPTAVEGLVALVDSFCRSRSLFKSLCQRLAISHSESIACKATHPKLLQSINGYIDPQLVNTLSEGTGSSTEQTFRALIQLSLGSQLICWPILGEAGNLSSVSEFISINKSETTVVAWLLDDCCKHRR
jgi:hypothetical protein